MRFLCCGKPPKPPPPDQGYSFRGTKRRHQRRRNELAIPAHVGHNKGTSPFPRWHNITGNVPVISKQFHRPAVPDDDPVVWIDGVEMAAPTWQRLIDPDTGEACYANVHTGELMYRSGRHRPDHPDFTPPPAPKNIPEVVRQYHARVRARYQHGHGQDNGAGSPASPQPGSSRRHGSPSTADPNHVAVRVSPHHDSGAGVGAGAGGRAGAGAGAGAGADVGPGVVGGGGSPQNGYRERYSGSDGSSGSSGSESDGSGAEDASVSRSSGRRGSPHPSPPPPRADRGAASQATPPHGVVTPVQADSHRLQRSPSLDNMDSGIAPESPGLMAGVSPVPHKASPTLPETPAQVSDRRRRSVVAAFQAGTAAAKEVNTKVAVSTAAAAFKRVRRVRDKSSVKALVAGHTPERLPAARQQVISLTDQQLAEMHSMMLPSASVAVLSAVLCVLCGIPPSWTHAQLVLQKRNIRTLLVGVQPEKVTDGQVSVVQSLAQQGNMQGMASTHELHVVRVLSEWALALVCAATVHHLNAMEKQARSAARRRRLISKHKSSRRVLREGLSPRSSDGTPRSTSGRSERGWQADAPHSTPRSEDGGGASSGTRGGGGGSERRSLGSTSTASPLKSVSSAPSNLAVGRRTRGGNDGVARQHAASGTATATGVGRRGNSSRGSRLISTVYRHDV